MTRLEKVLILFLALLLSGSIHAQSPKGDSIPGGGGLTNDVADFCEDFSNSNLGGWESNPADPDILTLTQSGPTGDPSDVFLQVNEASDVTFLQNTNNYDGNWVNLGTCFCFDVIALDGVDPLIPLRFTLVIESGSQSAEFEFSQTLTEDMGWIKLCAPIAECTGGNLPANEFGQWALSSGGSSCLVWNSIITNVTSVRIEYDDINFTNEVVGFDNLCIGDCGDSGSTCCDDSPNLIINGNFEGGNVGFISDYSFTANYSANSIAPGMYGVGSAVQALAVSPNWILEDHSSCAGFQNDRVLLVNGRTQQPGSGFPYPPFDQGNLIWEQSITDFTPGADYQFCGSFKNLPQTAFDILPEIYINITSSVTNTFGPFTINAGPGACDWEEISAEFTTVASTQAIHIQIYLVPYGNGDGNDLAIDDLGLHELQEVDFGISVTGIQNGVGLEGSFGLPGSGDDGQFDPSCSYVWRVIDLDANVQLGIGHLGFSTTGFPWALTTTFPDLTFQVETDYRVEMEIFDCECFADGIRWQEIRIGPLGEAQLMNSSGAGGRKAEHDQIGRPISFYPNPSNGLLKAEVGDQTTELQLMDLQGKVLRTWTLSGKIELDLSEFPAGTYFMKYQSETRSGTQKVILQ